MTIIFFFLIPSDKSSTFLFEIIASLERNIKLEKSIKFLFQYYLIIYMMLKLLNEKNKIWIFFLTGKLAKCKSWRTCKKDKIIFIIRILK